MKKITSLLFALIIISALCYAQTGNIKLNKGQKFFIDNKITAITTQQLLGQSMESNAEILTNFTIDVKEIKNNNFNLNNTFTRVTAKISAMGNNINFDSDKKEDMNGEYGSSLKEIINQPKQILINRWGKVLNAPALQNTADKSQVDVLKMMMQQFLGDPDETGYGVTVAFVSVPAKIVKGFNWTDSSTKDGIQKSTIYTVKNISENTALVSISGILNTDANMQMHGMDFQNKSKGNITGEEIIDITTGIIKQRKTTVESTGTVSVKSQGLEIPMTTKIISVSSVKPS